MPLIEVILNPGNTGADVHELHEQLLVGGAVIDPGEQTATTFGSSTVAAVRAFRERHGLPDGDAVDLPTARLMHVASTFAVNGDRAALRAAVREASTAADTSQPQALYALARYALVAGEYQTAHDIAQRIPDHEGIRAVIDPILVLPGQPLPAAAAQPSRPEVPYPENFYTYRYDLVPLKVLNELLEQGVTHRITRGIVRQRPRARNGENEIPDDLPPPPDPPDDPTLPPDTRVIEAAQSWLEAAQKWRTGNEHFEQRHYAKAAGSYEASQQAALRYFKIYYGLTLGGPAAFVRDPLASLVFQLDKRAAEWSNLWEDIQQRRLLLSLVELHGLDWEWFPYSAEDLLRQYLAGNPEDDEARKATRQHLLDRPMLILATVFVPLARAEANRARRQYPAVLSDLALVLNGFHWRIVSPEGPVFGSASFTCDFIERPFVQLLLAEILLEQADVEYKARTPAAEPQAPDVTQFQSLKAAQSYLAVKEVFKDDAQGAYVSRVETAATKLTEAISHHLAEQDTRSAAFQMLGKDILIETITSASTTLPGLDRTRKAHEPLLTFTPPEGQTVMRETNPRVYAILLTVTARLEQLKAGFNYLGYLDTYVPPWRFQFLLERARYFAEHAKSAQREYLNFLSNAEREEFQELSAAQNVEMEKSNVRIETARVEQVLKEVSVSEASSQLAQLTAVHAQTRFQNYAAMDERIDDIERESGFWSTIASIGNMAVSLGTAAATGGVTAPILFGNVVSFFGQGMAGQAQRDVADEQREFEKQNLQLASSEAQQASHVAQLQLDAAKAGLVVAGLQRQAALLRHEFAVQNLDFLRNRVLNAEQWYRLVVAIRSVSETYLRYSVELAFLAEQAYEFEADKRINVMRFDYDLSEVGDFLAADFLLKDLDTLEQDLIVTQRQRQQQVRYVLSMAREFPEALQEIRENGKTTFSLRLEQLEKRFPGLYNLRIGAVDVLPVALLDSTRFSLELTHLGTSQVRLKAQPDTPPGIPSPSPLNTNDMPVPAGGWLADLQETWPIKLRVTGPETTVFSGLSRQDASAVFAFATTGQRHAFEALGAATAWQVDFTARENQVVPESLADLLITFTLSGYHDSELRKAIDAVKPETSALTSFLSARQTFPDAFYDFSRTGRIVWKVPRALLTLTGDLGRLRNIGFSLRPGALDVHFSRLMTRLRVNFRVDGSGGVASGVTVFTEMPEIKANQTAPLTVAVRAALNAASEIAWDFGDGTPILRSVRSGGTPITPAEGVHTYAKPGRYVMKLRCVQNNALSEFRISVVVARNQKLGDPLVIFLPSIKFDTPTKSVIIKTGGAFEQAGRILWRVGDATAEGRIATFTLKPGNYTLDFAAVRQLKFRAYGTQRYVNSVDPLFLRGLNATTNRTFDPNGAETNGTGTPPLPARNKLAKLLFDKGEISPEDEWTFELIPEEILGLPAGTVIGAEELDLSDIQDVVLSMEYDITPGSS